MHKIALALALSLISVAGLVSVSHAAPATAQEAFDAAKSDFAAQKFESARENFTAVLAFNPTPEQKARVHLMMGLTYSLESKFEEARRELLKVAEIEGATQGTKDVARSFVASSYSSQGDSVKARELYQAIVDDPKADMRMRSNAQSDIAFSYFYAKDYERARAEWAKELAMRGPDAPSIAGTRLQIARSYVQQENFDEARREYEKIVTMKELDKEQEARFIPYKQIAQSEIALSHIAQAASQYKALLENPKLAPNVKSAAVKRLSVLQKLIAESQGAPGAAGAENALEPGAAFK